MAHYRIAAGPFSPARRDVAIAPAGAGRVNRSAQFPSESVETQRLCPDRRLVVGRLAIGWTLSADGHIG
jgi:hypothetical protein